MFYFALLFVTAVMAVPVPQEKFKVLKPQTIQPLPTAVLEPPKYYPSEIHAEEEEIPKLEVMTLTELTTRKPLEACEIGDKACYARNNLH